MAIHYRTKAFIFKKSDRFESDRIFTIFTENFGRLEILAKAIRKITSKLRPGIEVFYLSEIEFIQGKTHKTLTDARVLEKFENIKKDLERLKTAFQISEVLDNFLKFEQKDEEIWKLILDTFQKLNNSNLQPKIDNLQYYYFLWNFFSGLGYQPELYHCSLCQKKLIPDNLYFSAKEGGIACSVCAKSKKEPPQKKKESGFLENEIVNLDTIKILRIILKKDWQTFLKLKTTPVSQKLLKHISKNYTSYLLQEHSRTNIIKSFVYS